MPHVFVDSRARAGGFLGFTLGGATKVRERTIEQLRRQGKLEVFAARAEADAVIQGSGSFWLTGYVSTDPRSPSTTRQAVFQGFLSVELLGKDNDPLWSYLVTPSRFRTGDITKDLADRLVEKFLEARKKSEAPPQAQPSPRRFTKNGSNRFMSGTRT
jgi:hypothetical protein